MIARPSAVNDKREPPGSCVYLRFDAYVIAQHTRVELPSHSQDTQAYSILL